MPCARIRDGEKLVIEQRNQRSAFAAVRDVARTEIGDGLDPCARGDHRGFADLKRARDFAAQEFDRIAFVEDGLAVGADQFDFFNGTPAARSASAKSSPTKKLSRAMVAV